MKLNWFKVLLIAFLMPTLAFAQKSKKPNILVIWGDDIGWSNVSYMNNGLMGYKRPILIVLLMKARCSPIGMPNNPAQPAALHLFLDNIRSEQVF